jgi:hypothetical protein
MKLQNRTNEVVVVTYPLDWHWALSVEYQNWEIQNGAHVEIFDLSYLGEFGFRTLIRKTLGGNHLRKNSERNVRAPIVRGKISLFILGKALLKTIGDYRTLPSTIDAKNFREIYNTCVEKSGNLILYKSKIRSLVFKELYAYHLIIESLNKVDAFKFDCVVTVNGRFTKNAAVMKWAEQRGMRSKLIEFGADKQKFEIYEVSPHSMTELESKIARLWQMTDPVQRVSVGRNFMTKLADNKPITDIDWRARMTDGYIPSKVKPKQCTFFASTETEYAGVGDVIPKENFSNQVEAFRAIVDLLPASEWQIVLRRHPKNPHGGSVDPEAFLWDEFNNHDNVLMIEPESVVDSIALGLNSDVVFNFCSIIAMELIARGYRNVYTLGPSPWRRLLPNLQAENWKLLENILENEAREIEKESVLPWCFYAATHGHEFQIIFFDEVSKRWLYQVPRSGNHLEN